MKFRYDPRCGALYITGQVLGVEFLSLEEFAEFASRQRKAGVELPDRLEHPGSFRLNLD